MSTTIDAPPLPCRDRTTVMASLNRITTIAAIATITALGPPSQAAGVDQPTAVVDVEQRDEAPNDVGAAEASAPFQEAPGEPSEVEADAAISPPPAPPRPAGGFFGAGLRAVFDAIAPVPQPRIAPLPVDEAEDGEMPQDAQQAQQWQQRKQIRQQAKQMEQLFQPVLRTELEMVRQACPNLSLDARRELLSVGTKAVTRTALDFATRQMLGGRPGRVFDARRSIQAPIARALEPLAGDEEFVAYVREQKARDARRAAAARVAIVAKLDRQLDLTSAQREAIQADLEAGWKESWLRELDDTGMVMNNYRPAPDYANACIEPHLDEVQKAEWLRWRKAAGTAVVGMNFGWNFDGQGLQQEDDWWTR
jgi:hypothetical protein